MGVGEASFVSLAAPYILDVAPEGQVINQLQLFFALLKGGFVADFILYHKP